MQLLSGTRVELFSEMLFVSWDNGQLPVFWQWYTSLSWKNSGQKFNMGSTFEVRQMGRFPKPRLKDSYKIHRIDVKPLYET